MDAGLIALVLATFALVLGPYVYSGIDQRVEPRDSERPEGPEDPDTSLDDRSDS